MKQLIFSLFIIFSLGTSAQEIESSIDLYSVDLSSSSSQSDSVEKVAKSIRRRFHIAGHEFVSSEVLKLAQQDVEKFLGEEFQQDLEMPLVPLEIERLKQCYSEPNCELYRIYLSSSYMSGTGIEYYWSMLLLDQKRVEIISQIVYEE